MLAFGLILVGLLLLVISALLVKSFTGNRDEAIKQVIEVETSSESNLASWEHSNSLELTPERSSFPINDDN